MLNVASLIPGFAAKPVKQVLEELMVSVRAFWRANQLSTKHAIGATQRLLRVQRRIDVLLERFRAGKLRKWQKRRPRVAREVDAAADDAEREKPKPGERKKRYGLPVYYGWLNQKMPQVAVMLGSDLELSLQSDEMQALMRCTPEVARISRPILGMLGLDETVLLVPEGYGEVGPPNKRHMAPDPKPADPNAYEPPFDIPEGYDEDRDGRQPDPLRDPSWRYWAYKTYRDYLYYYMNRRPAAHSRG